MKKSIYFLLIITPLFFLTACSDDPVQTRAPVQETSSIIEGGISATESEVDCNLGKYNMDCDVVKFLEEELAWTTEEAGVDFCAYTLVGEDEGIIYAKALCEEYYLQDKKTVCPDRESIEECFVTKDAEKSVCKEKCETENIDPYLVTGSGVSIPVKITREEDVYTLWQPGDGNLYEEDLLANFSKDAYKRLKEVDGGRLQDMIVERAEKYFDAKVTFNVSGEIDKTCSDYSDCGLLPGGYGMRSNCPHTMKCIEGSCVAGCYDFFDYTDFPVLREYSWAEVIDFIYSGEVEGVFQTHALDIELDFKDGRSVRAKEPSIDAIFKVIEDCGEQCEGMIKATE